jgi:citrate lyase subunit beta/citryl-CoA lyase
VTAATELRERPPRSLLFVPADRAGELLPKAIAAGPDAIILDLEDAIRPDRRAEARAELVGAVGAVRAVGAVGGQAASRRPPIMIRVGRAGGPELDADLELVVGLAGVGIVLPKCDGPGDVVGIVRAWTTVTSNELALLPIVETARGVLHATEIAAADEAVIGLALGAEDLAAGVGFRRSASGDEILLARSMVVLAAAAGGRWAVDTPNLALGASDVVRRDARRAAALGFVGKLVIHPAQVAPVNAAFTPSAADVARARRVVAAAERYAADGRAVGSVDDRMIDQPSVEAARRLLARAGRFAIGGNQA